MTGKLKNRKDRFVSSFSMTPLQTSCLCVSLGDSLSVPSNLTGLFYTQAYLYISQKQKTHLKDHDKSYKHNIFSIVISSSILLHQNQCIQKFKKKNKSQFFPLKNAWQYMKNRILKGKNNQHAPLIYMLTVFSKKYYTLLRDQLLLREIQYCSERSTAARDLLLPGEIYYCSDRSTIVPDIFYCSMRSTTAPIDLLLLREIYYYSVRSTTAP